jgi:hypothetical protein
MRFRLLVSLPVGVAFFAVAASLLGTPDLLQGALSTPRLLLGLAMGLAIGAIGGALTISVAGAEFATEPERGMLLVAACALVGASLYTAGIFVRDGFVGWWFATLSEAFTCTILSAVVGVVLVGLGRTLLARYRGRG